MVLVLVMWHAKWQPPIATYCWLLSRRRRSCRDHSSSIPDSNANALVITTHLTPIFSSFPRKFSLEESMLQVASFGKRERERGRERESEEEGVKGLSGLSLSVLKPAKLDNTRKGLLQAKSSSTHLGAVRPEWQEK